MSDYDHALSLWPAMAEQASRLVTANGLLPNWKEAAVSDNAITYILRGDTYTVLVIPRIVGLNDDGRAYIQTSVHVNSALAERLDLELDLANCWPGADHYRLGSLTIYLEWLAGNLRRPPAFRPTLWSTQPVAGEIVEWAAQMSCLERVVAAVIASDAVYPQLEELATLPRHIVGNPPVWGSEFDRAICMLDTQSPTAVVVHLRAYLKERRAQASDAASIEVLQSVACELGKLDSWLTNRLQ